MSNFLTLWNEAATTSIGFFWMALWAFVGIVSVSLVMHYSLAVLGLLPDFSGQVAMADREFLKWNYQSVLNITFLAMTVALIWVIGGVTLPLL